MNAGNSQAGETYEDAHLRGAEMDLKMTLQAEGEKRESKEERTKEIDQEMAKDGKSEAEKAKLQAEKAQLEREVDEIDRGADAKKEGIRQDLAARREEFDDPIKEQVKLTADKAKIEADLAKVQADIKSAESKNEQPSKELADKQSSSLKEREENAKDLAQVTKKIENKKLLAKNEAYHAMEEKAAEAKLAEDLNDFNDKQTAKAEIAAAPPEAAGSEPVVPGAPEPTQQKEGATEQEPSSWSDRMKLICSGLAKGLADDPPNPDNPIEKLVFKGKGIALQLAMAFSGGTEWLQDPSDDQKCSLTEDQRTMLKKTLGLVVVEESTDGSTPKTFSVKWEEPDEAFRAPEGGLLLVMKDIYGTNWVDSALQNLDPKTTLKDFKTQIAAMEAGDAKTQNETLLTRMTASGSTNEDNVLKYVEENWRLLRNETPQTAAPVTPPTTSAT